MRKLCQTSSHHEGIFHDLMPVTMRVLNHYEHGYDEIALQFRQQFSLRHPVTISAGGKERLGADYGTFFRNIRMLLSDCVGYPVKI